jgi:hypothetical protein
MSLQAVPKPETRKVADCRNIPSQVSCSLRISGTEDEVVRAATEHAVSVHGEKDSPELREQIRKSLQDEEEATFSREDLSKPQGPLHQII